MNCSSYSQAGVGGRTGYLDWEKGTSTVPWCREGHRRDHDMDDDRQLRALGPQGLNSHLPGE